jgi:hypothetical protein
MKYRIAMWASLGFLVASCWAVYAIGNRPVHEPPDAGCVVHGPLAPDLSRDHGRQIVPVAGLMLETLHGRWFHSKQASL